MKSLYLTAAALLLASTAAQAGNGISFQVEGQKIRVEQPRGCNSLSCLQITAPGLSAKSFNLNNINLNGFKKGHDDDDDVATTTPAQPTPQTAPAPQAPAPAAVANTAPPPPPAPAPAVTYAAPTTQAPVAATAPAPQAPQVATVVPAPQPAPVAAVPTTPIGVWATEENKGNVRIEQCGANLCGYAEKTGEHILINMKPSADNKWTGRIHDPDGGGDYDSTIAMKGSNVLKVQGCAFGGMFCGGQTWKRVS